MAFKKENPSDIQAVEIHNDETQPVPIKVPASSISLPVNLIDNDGNPLEVLPVAMVMGTVYDTNAGEFVQVVSVKISCSSAGDNQIIVGSIGERISVLGFALHASGNVTAKWRSDNVDVSGPMYLGANGNIALAPSGIPLFKTFGGEALNLNLSAAVAVGGLVIYAVILE